MLTAYNGLVEKIESSEIKSKLDEYYQDIVYMYKNAYLGIESGGTVNAGLIKVLDNSYILGHANFKELSVDSSLKVLRMGNSDGSAFVRADQLTGMEGLIFLDPTWGVVDNDINKATQFAVKDFGADGLQNTIVVGRASVLSLGTNDLNEALNMFAQSKQTFGESNITALAYIAKPVKLNGAGLVVDGSLNGDSPDGNFQNPTSDFDNVTVNITDPLGGPDTTQIGFGFGLISNTNGVFFGQHSMLMVDGNAIKSEAAINNITDGAKVDATSKLYIDVSKATTGTIYKILAGNGISGWQADNILGDRITELSIADEDLSTTGVGVNNPNQFNVYVKNASHLPDPEHNVWGGVIPHVINEILSATDTEAHNWAKAAIKDEYSDAEVAEKINAMANMSELAAVNHGVANFATAMGDNIISNLSLASRPAITSTKAEVINTASKGDAAEITTVEVGKSNSIMPEQYKKLKYDKQVWASYVHSKENVDGMKLGGMDAKYDLNYNGTTVGADLWTSSKVIGGLAITYADGKVSGFNGASTRNEMDYYGVSVYNRVTNGDSAIITDFGYIKADNDITQTNSGVAVTAKPKSDAITAGVTAQKAFKFAKGTLVPSIGARVTHVNTKDFSNSIDMHYNTDKQTTVQTQLGLSWHADYAMNDGWMFRPTVEAGYVFNLGKKDVQQTVSFNGVSDSFNMDVTDGNSYYAKLGMQFVKKDMTFGISYRYQKGEEAKNRKLNISAQFTF